jgi:hypothetical protein
VSIFISYRRYDWAFAHYLHEQLQRRLDCEVYIDRNITSDNYETELLGKVHLCAIFVLIVTPSTFDADRITQDDDWVRRELSLALQLGKPIVLVLHAGLAPPPPETLPEDIRPVTRRQGVEFYPTYFDQAVEELARHCVGLVPPGAIGRRALGPPPAEWIRERNLEAAMPAENARGAVTEVRVKVSAIDSKGLRGELPARLRSGDEIKKSDTKATRFPMTFETDAAGRPLPATLCVEVTSPYFDVDFAAYRESQCGDAWAEMQLPPDLDSRTVVFTLTPRSQYVGVARVMVRVFHRGAPIAELGLATTIRFRVLEVEYVLESSPLLVGARSGARPSAEGAAPMPVDRPTAMPTPDRSAGRPASVPGPQPEAMPAGRGLESAAGGDLAWVSNSPVRHRGGVNPAVLVAVGLVVVGLIVLLVVVL